MKLHMFRSIVLALALPLLIGCSATRYVEVHRNDFSRIKDIKITSVYRTNGDTEYFNWDGGRYIQYRTKDSVSHSIEGLNTVDSAVSIPMSSVVRVYGEYYEDSQAGTAGLTVALTLLTEIAIIVAIISNISFH
ncbi:MAG: hypothetical protein U0264_15005 [Candidatus Kapaibacterium sp.]